MRAATFFRYLGRFNQLLYAALGAAVALFIAAVLAREALIYFRRHPGHDITLETGDAREDAAKLTLDRWGSGARGTSITVYAVRSTGLYSAFSTTKDGSSIVNFYFFDASSGEGRWLFRDNRQIICSDYAFPNAGGSATPVRAMVFLVARTDTDGNGRMDCRDKKTLAAARMDGTGYAEFYEGVEAGELNAWAGSPEPERPYIDLLIRKDGAWRILVIDPDRPAVTRDHRIEGQAVP